MDTSWKTIIWSQFGAAIDTFENALSACPDDLWDTYTLLGEFWSIAFHTLFFLDLYLSGAYEGFALPAPFKVIGTGSDPERLYTKDELHTYLNYCRDKFRMTVQALTEEKAFQRCAIPWLDLSFGELLLYNMRHVQEHASQLSLILGQKLGAGPGWVARTKSNLE